MSENIYPPRKIEEIPYPAFKRYLMEISFDGSAYGGWQIQPNADSVQETVQKVLKRLYDNLDIELTGSSRTDAGVHASAFAAAFPVPDSPAIPLWKLKNALNRLLPTDIKIRSIVEKPLEFHARFDAKQRTYIYRILNTRYPPALERNRVWWYSRPLNEIKMNEAAQFLIGKHDFSTFRASECQAKSPVKTIDFIKIKILFNFIF